MDEFLEFWNKWLVRPVAIITALGTVIGFGYVAIVALSQTNLSTVLINVDLPPIPEPQIPPIRLDIVIPGWTSVWESAIFRSVAIVFLVLGAFSLMFGLMRLGEKLHSPTLYTLGPGAVAFVSCWGLGVVAGAFANEDGTWKISMGLADAKIVSDLIYAQQGDTFPTLLAVFGGAALAFAAPIIVKVAFDKDNGWFERWFVFPICGLLSVSLLMVPLVVSALVATPPAPSGFTVASCSAVLREQISAPETNLQGRVQQLRRSTEALTRMRTLTCYHDTMSSRSPFTLAILHRGDGADNRCEVVRVRGVERDEGIVIQSAEHITSFVGRDCPRAMNGNNEALQRHVEPQHIRTIVTPPGAPGPRAQRVRSAL